MKHIPIYIINLSKDIERKKFIVQQMRKNNIVDYSFFVAIYAKDFTTKQIDSQYDRERVRKELGRELKTGEI
jgi:GR25 family glycosyltransferase involved in LPS biosynthesis